MSPEKSKNIKEFLDKYSTDTLMQLAQQTLTLYLTWQEVLQVEEKVGDMKHAGSHRKMKQMSDSERLNKMRDSEKRLKIN